jgi:hypothetical protein
MVLQGDLRISRTPNLWTRNDVVPRTREVAYGARRVRCQAAAVVRTEIVMFM